MLVCSGDVVATVVSNRVDVAVLRSVVAGTVRNVVLCVVLLCSVDVDSSGVVVGTIVPWLLVVVFMPYAVAVDGCPVVCDKVV